VGWAYEGPVPTEKKFVMLATPHTSNWDGLLLVLLTRSVGLDIQWMVKDQWVKGPVGPLVRGVGGVGIDRSRPQNLVEQMVEQFNTRDRFILAIPPEGTRSLAQYWKSGFYYIARGADVPVVPGYLDYARKRAGLGPARMMTGDVKADMDALRAFYAEKDPRGSDHSKFGPIRLKDEDAAK
jgi:1-acyl-sn-glycerol-3-phosphate acyltransferase